MNTPPPEREAQPGPTVLQFEGHPQPEVDCRDAAHT